MLKRLLLALLFVASAAVAGNNSQWANPGTSLTTQTVTRHVKAVAGGPSFTPLKLISVVNGTVGASASGTKGFSAPASRTLISNAVTGAYGGNRVVSTGFDAVNENSFGGDLWNSGSAAAGIPLANGQQLWIRIWFYIPSGFSWQYSASGGSGDGNAFLKWIRIWTNNSTLGANDGSDYIWQLYTDGQAGVVTPPTAGGATLSGYLKEFNSSFFAFSASGWADQSGTTMPRMPTNTWTCEEYHITWATDGTGGVDYWRNDVYQTGATGQTYQTVGHKLQQIQLGDYWNGASPQAQVFYLDDVIITAQTPDATDGSGRPMIGCTRKVSDFP